VEAPSSNALQVISRKLKSIDVTIQGPFVKKPSAFTVVPKMYTNISMLVQAICEANRVHSE
jgi:hypothetical protein